MFTNVWYGGSSVAMVIFLIRPRLCMLIQFFIFWVFEPFSSFLESILEIRFLPILALVGLFFLFSVKNNEPN